MQARRRAALAAAPPARAQLPRAVDVAVGRHALHLDGGADLLWLRLLRFRAGRSLAILLEQHGRDGDLDARRRALDPERARRAVPAVGLAVPARLHELPLGDRKLVDPDAGRARRVALRAAALSAALRPAQLGAVFPLGMYAVANWQMARALDLPFLDAIPYAFVYLALPAWTAAFLGLFGTLWSGFRQPSLDL